jgi:hypothetical protein
MFLQKKESGDLIEILDIQALFNPTEKAVRGQGQAGQEEQEPTSFEKEGLIFPSGENLPRCWTDANYKSA